MKKRKRIQKEFTKEDLKKMGLISNGDRLPRDGLTDEKWQAEFNLRKKFLTPYPEGTTKIKVVKDEFCQAHTYSTYINDTAKNLRNGEVEYAFFIYQIEELYKLFPLNLKTSYLPRYGCFSVWLSNEITA